MDFKDFCKVYDVIFDMAEKTQATKYISLKDFKQECDKTGVDMENDYYGYEAALEMYCGLLKNMNTDGLTYYTNPMWAYLFNHLPGVEPEVYEAFESDGLDAEELCNKIDREFKAEIENEEVIDPYDVCMWWFAMGVAYSGSQIIKDKCKEYKQVEA